MSRIKGLTVALSEDVGEEEAGKLIDAILRLRGVADVSSTIVSANDWMNRAMIRRELWGKIVEVFDEFAE